jgi:hypothetical protein
MIANRFVERVELQSKRPPAEVFDALRNQVEDCRESKLVRRPLERAIKGLSIDGDAKAFQIRVRPFVADAICVGAIEQLSSGCRVSAQLRFRRSTYIGLPVWALLGFGVFFYDTYWGDRSPNTLTFSLVCAALLSMLMTALALGILHEAWNRYSPIRDQYRELLARAVEGTASTHLHPDTTHAQTDAS